MNIYRVWVKLEAEFDDIEAETPEEAFLQASDFSMNGSSWEYTVEEIKAEK